LSAQFATRSYLTEIEAVLAHLKTPMPRGAARAGTDQETRRKAAFEASRDQSRARCRELILADSREIVRRHPALKRQMPSGEDFTVLVEQWRVLRRSAQAEALRS
jgi:hypothetical protein